MKNLIADDNVANRHLLRIYFSGYGISVTANDGIEAVAAFKEALEAGERFDLICLDYYMPRMDGIEALKIIRQIESEHQVPRDEHVRVIMMSAVNDKSVIMKAYINGCDSFLIHPCRKDRFIEEIYNVGLLPQTVS